MINHTTDEHVIYFSNELFKHDPNFTCTLLFTYLHNHLDKSGNLLYICVKLMSTEDRPKHLQIQLDNCSRENKNQTVFQLAGYLVSVLKWYMTVQINFLLVGHSHDEIDRWHSESAPLRFKNSRTLETFLNNYREVQF